MSLEAGAIRNNGLSKELYQLKRTEGVKEKKRPRDESDNEEIAAAHTPLGQTPKSGSENDVIQSLTSTSSTITQRVAQSARDLVSFSDDEKNKPIFTLKQLNSMAEEWNFFNMLQPFIEHLSKKGEDLRMKISTLGVGAPNNVTELTPILHLLKDAVKCGNLMIKEERNTFRSNLDKKKLPEFLWRMQDISASKTQQILFKEASNNKKKNEKIFWNELSNVTTILTQIKSARESSLSLLDQQHIIEKILYRIPPEKLLQMESEEDRWICSFSRIAVKNNHSHRIRDITFSPSVATYDWFNSLLKILDHEDVAKRTAYKSSKKGKEKKVSGSGERKEFLNWLLKTDAELTPDAQKEETKKQMRSPYYDLLQRMTDVPITTSIEAMHKIWPFLNNLADCKKWNKRFSYNLHFQPSQILPKIEGEIRISKSERTVIQHRTHAIAVKIINRKNNSERNVEIILLRWQVALFKQKPKVKYQKGELRVKALFKVRHFPKLKRHWDVLREYQSFVIQKLNSYQQGQHTLSNGALVTTIMQYPK